MKMNFKKWINRASHIGKVNTFYLPADKLNVGVKKKLHEFFMKNYFAYTHEISKIQGYWSKDSKIVKDKHERYEVSFKGKKNREKFVDFMSEICYIIGEDSIYLTIGGESYLVGPKEVKNDKTA